ncbi:MAG: sodium:solute symporter family protein [Candidatus Latescibacterota bacterium]|jgi:Na+/proline symporter
MTLQTVDWGIVIGYFAVSLLIGLLVTRRAGSSTSEFFLSGRHMPWWLLGISMVATTFSNSVPNLVTDIVRTHGVAGNWLWWAFLLTGMLTVFVYAKLWRRSGVMTDNELYELRYSGRSAAFLRGFRALYLGILFNGMIMADCSLAAVKLGGVMFGYSPLEVLVVAGAVTVVYSMMGGLLGVLITDFFQFIVAMVGAVLAAWFALSLPEVGGMAGLLSHPAVLPKLSFLPDFSDHTALVTVLVIPLAVQWWSVWYPGAEPGGGGYVAQRMLAAKDEKHAVGATLLFNICHYAVRPWPWIIVALASIVVFPDLASLERAFPGLEPRFVENDMAYPAMLTFLPAGAIGLMLASLFAAYMSTISTHLNWGSSYIVNDFYRRFLRPAAGERELVLVGRLSTLVLMLVGSGIALLYSNSLKTFDLWLQIGAGTGLVFILRWFWWRINAWSEVAAMAISFLVAWYFQSIHGWLGLRPLPGWLQLLLGVVVTTVGWVSVTFLTRPSDEQVLRRFCRLVQPGGPGWRWVVDRARDDGDPIPVEPRWDVPAGVACMFLGCVAVYGALFSTGYFLYGNLGAGAILLVVTVLAGLALMRYWGSLRVRETPSAPPR